MTTTSVLARTTPAGMITTVHDSTANDSNKSFTVPTGKRWELKYIQALLACTATVGNRHLEVQFLDASSNVIFETEYITLVASEVGRVVLIPGASRATGISVWGDTTAKGNVFTLPPMYLDAGMSIKVWDLSAVDAAADDLTVSLQYVEIDQ